MWEIHISHWVFFFAFPYRYFNGDCVHCLSFWNSLYILLTRWLCTLSPKTEMAEIHVETNVIEKKYHRNGDDRYEDHRSIDCWNFSIIYTNIFSSMNSLSINATFLVAFLNIYHQRWREWGDGGYPPLCFLKIAFSDFRRK